MAKLIVCTLDNLELIERYRTTPSRIYFSGKLFQAILKFREQINLIAKLLPTME